MKVESVSIERPLASRFSLSSRLRLLASDSEFIESPYHIYGKLPSRDIASSRGYISSNSGAFRSSQQQLSFIGDWE
jgi:hypothetical protein